MKKFLYLALVFGSIAANAALPTTAEGWYTPEGGFEESTGTATLYYGFDKTTGTWKSYEIQVDAYGNILNGLDEDTFSRNYELRTAYEALTKAMQGERVIDILEQSVKTLGENLNAVINGDGITITGKDPNGNDFSYKLSFADGKGLGTDTPTVTDPTASYKHTDEKSLFWTDKNKASIKGWSDANNETKSLWQGGADGYAFLVRTAKDANGVKYVKNGGTHEKIFEADTNGKLRLYKFASPTDGLAAIYSLNNYLTNDDQDMDRNSIYLVVKYGDGIRYMPLGNTISTDTKVDETSIVTNETGIASVYGFADANDSASAAGEPYIPFVDGSDELQWDSFYDFFADNVFDVSSTTGKILLKGTDDSDDAESIRVLTVSGNGDNQALKTFKADNQSVDMEATGGVLQLHGYDTRAEDAIDSFADVLTNATVDVSNYYIPIAKNGGIVYSPVSKVTGIPSANVDDVTIELDKTDENNEKLQLHGASGDGITLTEGMVYGIGADKKGCFFNLSGDGQGDANPSIEIEKNDEGERIVRLYGWDNTIEGNGLIGWDENHALKYFEGSSLTRGVVLDDASGVQLSKYPNEVGAIPYSTSDSGNEDSLGWLKGSDRLVMMKDKANPVGVAIGSSITKDNVSAVPTLDIAGFRSASAGQVPTRNANGGITWKDIDSGTGGYSSITFVSDVSWDASTHQLKVTKKTVTAKITGTPTTVTEVVLTATSHAAEHEGE